MERLSVRQLCEGVFKARLTAVALLEDARLLETYDRYARAFALAYAAGEELGKVQLLVGAAIRLKLGLAVNWARIRTSYRSHDYKARTITYSDLYRLASTREGRELTFEESATLSEVAKTTAVELPKARMEALYSDFQSGRFVDPSEMIRPEDVTMIMSSVNADLSGLKFALLGGPDELEAMLDEPELQERFRSVYEHPKSVRD